MDGIRPQLIKKRLCKKIQEVGKSFKDTGMSKDLLEAYYSEVQVFGGAISSLLMGTKVNDYDFYFKSAKTSLDIADWLCTRRNNTVKETRSYAKPFIRPFENIKGDIEDRVFIAPSHVVEAYQAYLDDVEGHLFVNPLQRRMLMLKGGPKEAKLEYGVAVITDNAISLKSGVQLIMRFSGAYSDIVKNFDFIHTHCCYDYQTDNLITPNASLHSMMSKTLYYSGLLYPFTSVLRMKKFIERGWSISIGQTLKIMLQSNKVDMSDTETFIDQIMGVDILYINQFIAHINKASDMMDNPFVFEALLDKAFNEELEDGSEITEISNV